MKRLVSAKERRFARLARNEQWAFMEKVNRLGCVWFCPWDKDRRHENPKEDEDIHGLIDGMERLAWFGQHKDWWIVGRWSKKRCARPIRLTDAGRIALQNSHLYDMEPVLGGLVEPGFDCIPAK